MSALGQLLRVTPASWLKAPKRRRRGRKASLSSSLGAGGRGRRRRDSWLGKLRVLNPAARGNCCPHTGDARARLPGPSVWKGGGERGRRRFGPRPQAVAQFS